MRLARLPSLILASASPRRQELLARLGIPFSVRPSEIPEPQPPGPPADAVMELARAKARAVARLVTAEAAGERGGRTVVLGADTEVFLDGRALGKPADAADAGRMLRALRGRIHEVITGLALVEVGGGWEETASVTTRVRMADYSEAALEAYVATGEPFDKAGGYAVQGEGGRLVAEVDGCFTNVVGLPVETTRRLLAAWGLSG
ncbi:MAG TPA: Maf family protein [Candidatus Nitrosocosmicus sp.]|nr:Maf family protein [Candidatus Nitrosocosmicus sp.]